MSKAPETKITLRTSPDLMDIMRALARLHDRSLNGEIVRALREYVENHLSEWGHIRDIKAYLEGNQTDEQ